MNPGEARTANLVAVESAGLDFRWRHAHPRMRDGNHSKDIREYEITSKGVVIIGDRLTDYQGLITGIPVHLNRSGNHEKRSHERKAKSKTWKQSGINLIVSLSSAPRLGH